LISAIAVCSALISNCAFAHSDHDVISGQTAIYIAAKSVTQMTFKDVRGLKTFSSSVMVFNEPTVRAREGAVEPPRTDLLRVGE
jgi:hypothetical protein